MPTCSKCHPVRDLGTICPHQGPGLALWEQGRAAGRAEVAVVLLDLIAELRDRAPTYGDALKRMADHYEAQLREANEQNGGDRDE